MNKGPIKRKVPKGRPGGAVSAVRHAAANPKPKPKKKPSALKRLVKFAHGDYTK